MLPAPPAAAGATPAAPGGAPTAPAAPGVCVGLAEGVQLLVVPRLLQPLLVLQDANLVGFLQLGDQGLAKAFLLQPFLPIVILQ